MHRQFPGMPSRPACCTQLSGRSQRGMALILVIGFMAILSLLGAVVLDVVNRGIQQTGLIIPAEEAFYTVDRAVEYSLNTDVIQAINKKLIDDPGNPNPIINFMTETTKDADENDVPHVSLISAGGLSLTSGRLQFLGTTELSAAQISRIAAGSSHKDIFIRYHVNAAACPRNSDCVATPEDAVRVDAHLVEVRPNPSGSSGSSEEGEASIWGS